MGLTNNNDASEIFVAGDGHIYVAPLGTTLPDAFDDSLDGDYQDLGYLTPDGFRMTPAIETHDTMVWQSQSPVRTDVLTRTITLAMDFAQSNEDVATLYFGGGEFTGSVYSAPDASEGVDERVLVADVIDGSRQWRFWFPKVSLAANREVKFARSEGAAWGIDLKVLQVPGESLFGFDTTGDTEFPPADYPS